MNECTRTRLAKDPPPLHHDHPLQDTVNNHTIRMDEDMYSTYVLECLSRRAAQHPVVSNVVRSMVGGNEEAGKVPALAVEGRKIIDGGI